MSWVIVSLVVFVILFILLGINKKLDSRYFGWKLCKRQLLSLLAFLLVGLAMFAVVPANSVGIIYAPFGGGIQDQVLGEGVSVKSPFDTVYTISTEVQDKTMENLYVQTKDSQFLTLSVNVKYYVDESKAFTVFKNFRTLTNVDAQLIQSEVKKAIEEATTGYNIIECLGDQLPAIYAQVESSLAESLAKNGITLHTVTLLNIDGGDEIEAAIAAEAVAKKRVETAQQELAAAQIEAETTVVDAQAQADATTILAEAVSNNPDVLTLRWIEKWNGELPYFVSSDDSNVMVDMGDLEAAAGNE
jgi:regulator of protease activity HflC (stomatin/prohibitin superfamily)